MALRFHFVKDAGREIGDGGGTATAVELSPAEVDDALRGELDRLGLAVEGLRLEIEDRGDAGLRVTVHGQVASLERREKVVLALGNVRGVAEVEDGLLAADGTALDEGASDFYTVRDGDTLQEIAQRCYGDAAMARILEEANAGILGDPQRLAPGLMLRIPR